MQSWRADDRRLDVDSFPSRSSHGERILRVFSNVNPDGVLRVWRVGEPLAPVARRFLPQLRATRACRLGCCGSSASPNRCAANTTT